VRLTVRCIRLDELRAVAQRHLPVLRRNPAQSSSRHLLNKRCRVLGHDLCKLVTSEKRFSSGPTRTKMMSSKSSISLSSSQFQSFCFVAVDGRTYLSLSLFAASCFSPVASTWIVGLSGGSAIVEAVMLGCVVRVLRWCVAARVEVHERDSAYEAKSGPFVKGPSSPGSHMRGSCVMCSSRLVGVRCGTTKIHHDKCSSESRTMSDQHKHACGPEYFAQYGCHTIGNNNDPQWRLPM
jgi:hypothetical protein